MKSEFLMAITQLAAEKNLSKEVILSAVETALVSAYKKDSFTPNQNISVKINPATGEVKVFAQKTVVEKVTDPRREIALADAHKRNTLVQIDELLDVEATPPNAGRIAAQTAKQVVLQRLREAEHDAIFEEFHGRENDVVSGIIQRIEPKQITVELGRTQAVLPQAEQVPIERYRMGQRIRLYIKETIRTAKGTQIIVSRSHRNLLRRFLELEVPEIASGNVEIRAIAREAGSRSKVAVAARQPGIDPVGCCVGQRGIRIQNVVRELNGEKIDVVLWAPDPRVFIANALSPAQALSVQVSPEDKSAVVVAPDRQLSLAIGKEGQNARLAAKLTGWRIDIKSATAVEAEAVAKRAGEAELAPPLIPQIPLPQSMAEAAAPALVAPPPQAIPPLELPGVETEAEKVEVAALVSEKIALKEPAPEPVGLSVEEVFFAPVATEVKTPLRFAEDLVVTRSARPEPTGKKSKKRTPGREDSKGAEGEGRSKKGRRQEEYVVEEELDDGKL